MAARQSDPTPVEIETGCAKIRAGWTAQDRIMRRHGVTNASAEGIIELVEQVGWSAPTVSTAGLSRSESHLFAGA